METLVLAGIVGCSVFIVLLFILWIADLRQRRKLERRLKARKIADEASRRRQPATTEVPRVTLPPVPKR